MQISTNRWTVSSSSIVFNLCLSFELSSEYSVIPYKSSRWCNWPFFIFVCMLCLADTMEIDPWIMESLLHYQFNEERSWAMSMHTTAAVAAGLRYDWDTALSPPKSIPFPPFLPVIYHAVLSVPCSGDHELGFFVRWVLGVIWISQLATLQSILIRSIIDSFYLVSWYGLDRSQCLFHVPICLTGDYYVHACSIIFPQKRQILLFCWCCVIVELLQ